MDTQYIVVIVPSGKAFGPFNTQAAAEYAAMDYFGTGVTGASLRGDFMVLPLEAPTTETGTPQIPGGLWQRS